MFSTISHLMTYTEGKVKQCLQSTGQSCDKNAVCMQPCGGLLMALTIHAHHNVQNVLLLPDVVQVLPETDVA